MAVRMRLEGPAEEVARVSRIVRDVLPVRRQSPQRKSRKTDGVVLVYLTTDPEMPGGDRR